MIRRMGRVLVLHSWRWMRVVSLVFVMLITRWTALMGWAAGFGIAALVVWMFLDRSISDAIRKEKIDVRRRRYRRYRELKGLPVESESPAPEMSALELEADRAEAGVSSDNDLAKNEVNPDFAKGEKQRERSKQTEPPQAHQDDGPEGTRVPDSEEPGSKKSTAGSGGSPMSPSGFKRAHRKPDDEDSDFDPDDFMLDMPSQIHSAGLMVIPDADKARVCVPNNAA